MVNEGAFARQPILQIFVSLIMRHRDAIVHTLRTGAVYPELFLAGCWVLGHWLNQAPLQLSHPLWSIGMGTLGQGQKSGQQCDSTSDSRPYT